MSEEYSRWDVCLDEKIHSYLHAEIGDALEVVLLYSGPSQLFEDAFRPQRDLS